MLLYMEYSLCIERFLFKYWPDAASPSHLTFKEQGTLSMLLLLFFFLNPKPSVVPDPRICTVQGDCPWPLYEDGVFCVALLPWPPMRYLMGGKKGRTCLADLRNRGSYSTPCPLVPPGRQAIAGFMRVHQFPLEMGQ